MILFRCFMRLLDKQPTRTLFELQRRAAPMTCNSTLTLNSVLGWEIHYGNIGNVLVFLADLTGVTWCTSAPGSNCGWVSTLGNIYQTTTLWFPGCHFAALTVSSAPGLKSWITSTLNQSGAFDARWKGWNYEMKMLLRHHEAQDVVFSRLDLAWPRLVGTVHPGQKSCLTFYPCPNMDFSPTPPYLLCLY